MNSIEYEIDFGSELLDEEIKTLIENNVIQYHKELIDSLYLQNLVSNSISKVIYCFDLEHYVNRFNEHYKTQFSVTKEKEYSGVAINLICPMDDKESIFIAIAFNLLYNNSEYLKQTLLYQFLIEKSNDFLPLEMLQQKNGIGVEDAQNLDIVISQSISSWFSHWFIQKVENKVLNIPTEHILDYREYLINFKRNIKKLLYDVQSDDEFYGGNWNYVWHQYVYHFTRLIRNILPFEELSESYNAQSPEEHVIYSNILLEIRNICNAIYESKSYNFLKLKELFISISKLYDIHIKQNVNIDSGANEISFHIKTNPKVLFNGEVVETIPHFVSFVDILGFKDMIEEYQKNPQSTLLQDLKKAFEASLNQTKNVLRKVKDNFLQYKLFSDNFSAAIPFFESKEDYLHQFGLITILLQNYQYSMMSNGFFVRGGISDGDYFANDDMIFSGALVKAYNIESKIADCPRIVVDKEIIDNILFLKEEEIPDNLKESIVFDSLSELYFINPYINLEKQLQEFYNMAGEVSEELMTLSKRLMEPSKNELTRTNQVQLINEKINYEIKKIELRENKDSLKDKILKRYEWLQRFNQWYIDRESSEFEFLENRLNSDYSSLR